jgi:hypothetical protein
MLEISKWLLVLRPGYHDYVARHFWSISLSISEHLRNDLKEQRHTPPPLSPKTVPAIVLYYSKPMGQGRPNTS